ncbi:MAG: hypothetical protein MR210_03780 [Erysipelotrichaceae bacterium]|nr:hypothetical protein [Erysipelotrichaceae bacterium]MDY5252050.1 hypothetical protein [Erysipelotrichaceae bacterium]
MKSQVIKIRNLPSFPVILQSISVKPTMFLGTLMIVGVIMMIFFPFLGYLGAGFVALATFSILVMPDRKIMEATNEYLILYNHKDQSLCKLVYWDEILSWQYRWHPDVDELIIELSDHSVEKVEAFNRKKFTRFLKEYANGKEMKVKK